MAKPRAGFKKGQSGNPKGRPPIILPEVRRAVDQNKNAVKVMILEELNVLHEGEPKVRIAIRQVLERAITDGDVIKLKILLEIALGKVIEEPDSLDLSSEEKSLVLAYRKRCEQLTSPRDGSVSDSSQDSE